MNSYRFKKTEEIYNAALEIAPEKQALFLEKECGGDTKLKKEVEALLYFEDNPVSLLNAPPADLAAEMFAEQDSQTNLLDKEVGHYKILKLLGKGGMGEVYLAEDTKLNRKVAIKFIDEKFVNEKSSLDRFFFEAQSASAFNHLNIITVYEIGEFGKRPFIVTEFIDGVTLKEYILSKKRTLAEILEIAIQIASALSTAHKTGIIHRDIKPENMMIRQDGIVKVLDFGLAKYDSTETDPGAITRARFSTVRGTILGTPHFMSPEQVRGKPIDTRTDIWSFGVLFYQMLTQNLPFKGETTSDVIASILRSEPQPLSFFVSDISPTLENIIFKLFRKNQNERPQGIDEILDELKNYRHKTEIDGETIAHNYRISDRVNLENETDASLVNTTAKNATIYPNKFASVISQTIEKAKHFPVVSLLGLVTFASLLVILGIGVSRLNSSGDQSDSFQNMTLEKLTFDGMTTHIVAVSPDGKFIVYAAREEGKETLMVRQVEASSAVQRIPPGNVRYSGLAFSPDGNNIYYTVKENRVGTLHYIPVLGGNSQKLLENIDGKVTFSPDGKTIAFMRSSNLLMLADAKGSSQRLLAKSLPNEIRVSAEWSPDGRTIMSSVYSTAESKYFLAAVSAEDGSEVKFSKTDWGSILALTWLHDGSGIVISGLEPETKVAQLWMVSYPDGEKSKITNDFSTYVGVGLTADSESLVAIKQERVFNIWISPTDKPQSAKKITFEDGKDEGISGIDWTPKGELVYTGTPNRTIDIWRANADGSEKRKLTSDQGINISPIVSPDGRYIVFVSFRSQSNDIWRMDIDGGNAVALTDTPEQEGRPAFTPDGEWIVYQRENADKKTTIWKVSIDGGKPIQLTEIESDTPLVSPDGKYFVCRYGTEQPKLPAKLSIISIEGGKPFKTLDLPLVAKSGMIHWASDGKALIYRDKSRRAANLWSQSLDNSPPKQLTFFESGQIAAFSLKRDGKDFAISRGNESFDAVMIKNFR